MDNGIKFANRANIAKLGMHAPRKLIHEKIDCRTLTPESSRHVIGDVMSVGPFMFPVVTRVLESNFFTIPGVRFMPAFDEQLLNCFVVVVADFFPIADVIYKGTDFGNDIVMTAFLKFVGKSSAQENIPAGAT